MNFDSKILNEKENLEKEINSNINNEISELSNLKTEIEKSKIINNNDEKKLNNTTSGKLTINYGNCRVLKYDINNEPYLVLGPDYIYLIIIIILNLLVVIFFAIVQYCYSNLIVRIFGLILLFIQLYIYIYCSLKNPGFPKRAFQDPSLLNQEGGYYRRCRECGIIVDLRKFPGHCYKCKFCCEGFDHHCAWTTKCIGSGNIKEFNSFIGAFFILISYFGISAIWFEPSKNKCRINFFNA